MAYQNWPSPTAVKQNRSMFQQQRKSIDRLYVSPPRVRGSAASQLENIRQDRKRRSIDAPLPNRYQSAMAECHSPKSNQRSSPRVAKPLELEKPQYASMQFNKTEANGFFKKERDASSRASADKFDSLL